MLLRKVWNAVRFRRPVANFRLYRRFLEGKYGLEIGGPSYIFARRNSLPVYPIIGGIDGCNFSRATLWETSAGDGEQYVYNNRPKQAGRQYIRDAVDLGDIPSGYYDFVLASHSLEHVANPLRALSEWHRVLKPDGVLLLILPDRRATFDHRRPVTEFAHILQDFTEDTQEDDLTHVPEILQLHDLTRDPRAGAAGAFKTRCENNFANRALHHHVFDSSLIAQTLAYAGMSVIASDYAAPFHLITLAQKIDPPAMNLLTFGKSRATGSAAV